ncbi:MAG: hypothetical protein H6Q33_4158, partial [Deltaproteobacteria bacterium]|nr:hypothetical protein [Deltaproteobacteria bacterium]
MSRKDHRQRRVDSSVRQKTEIPAAHRLRQPEGHDQRHEKEGKVEFRLRTGADGKGDDQAAHEQDCQAQRRANEGHRRSPGEKEAQVIGIRKWGERGVQPLQIVLNRVQRHLQQSLANLTGSA